MLVQLHIENFALIEQLELQLGPGLNILTGETGAGKSIVIDAVNLVLGGRASIEFIRAGHEKAIVEALFEFKALTALADKLAAIGLELAEDLTLLMSRELTKAGKNICRINGRVTTLSMYREVGQYLIDISGQHDHQALLDPSKHIALLDGLGDKAFQENKLQLNNLYRESQQLGQRLNSLLNQDKERARELDLLLFQVKEIAQAKLRPGEEEELLRERQILAGAEKLAALSAEVVNQLTEGFNRQTSILDTLRTVITKVKEITAIDPSTEPLVVAIEGAYYQLQDTCGELRSYRESREDNPVRLELIEDRLDLIQRLKRKYGDSITEILAYQEQIIIRQAELENTTELISSLQAESARLAQQGASIANRLTDARQSLAAHLTECIQSELSELGMPQVRFAVNFTPLADWKAHGAENIEFLISPNPGEPLKPLVKIASGGELSRIMLAIKTIMAKADQTETLIFDEVDAGIGGRTAQAVGEKLARLSRDRQVICVTHSPQVSSFAETHFYIEKSVEKERTITKISKLDQGSRVNELARMLGGQSITETTIKHAQEMLQMASKV